MIIKNGRPNELVSTWMTYGSRSKKRTNLIRFDDKGEYVVPDKDLHMFNEVILDRLTNKGFVIKYEPINDPNILITPKEDFKPLESPTEHVENNHSVENGFKCTECDFIAKSEWGLKVHTRKH